MIEPRVRELIQAELDDALDAAGRAELAGRLLADPAVRAERESMRRLVAHLEAIPAAEPPAQLSQAVSAALQQEHGRRDRISAPAQGWRYAAAIAAVGLAGTLAYAIIHAGRPAVAELAGTLVKSHPGAAANTVQLLSGPVAGRVILTREGERLALRLDLDTQDPVDVEIVSGSHRLRLDGIARGAVARGSTEPVPLVGFAADGPDVSLTFLRNGQVVSRVTLDRPAQR
ncbi:MAG: hypothetical protein JSR54_16905 [Proteobacteria bacterium]|nr:hypothetical protein [Pseudomonadota bacterium]